MKKTVCVRPGFFVLGAFTRDELREYARSIGVPIGRVKGCVMRNLVESKDARVTCFLGK